MKLTLFSGFLTFSALTVSVGYVWVDLCRQKIEERIPFVFVTAIVFLSNVLTNWEYTAALFILTPSL